MIVFWIIAILSCLFGVWLANILQFKSYFLVLGFTLVLVDLINVLFGFIILNFKPDFEPAKIFLDMNFMSAFMYELPLSVLVVILFFIFFRNKIKEYQNK
jgi:hypothetical protein